MDISLSISKIYGFLPALEVKLSVIKIQWVLLAAIGGYGCQTDFVLLCIVLQNWTGYLLGLEMQGYLFLSLSIFLVYFV